MDSHLANLSFGFIKKIDHFCDPYFIKAPYNGITKTGSQSLKLINFSFTKAPDYRGSR